MKIFNCNTLNRQFIQKQKINKEEEKQEFYYNVGKDTYWYLYQDFYNDVEMGVQYRNRTLLFQIFNKQLNSIVIIKSRYKLW